jgi:hypothetical protein
LSTTLPMVLSFEEARLVDELRSIPESRLRELTLRTRLHGA